MTEEQIKIQEGLREALRSVNGRAMLWALLSEAGVYQCSAVFTGSPTDPHMTYFREGKRALGLHLVTALMAASPDAYAKLLAAYHADQADMNTAD
jgi:hypothetical protein